jgi:amino acid adenylation domain-containing protein
MSIPDESRLRHPAKGGFPNANRESQIRPTFDAPHSSLEHTLLLIFAELTGARDVTVDDDFFACGGDSLTAIRLSARIADQLSVDVSPAVVFNHPTVAQLGAWVRGLQSGGEQEISLWVPGARRGADMPLTYAQERVWLVQTLAPASAAYTFSARLRLLGSLDSVALKQALAALIARHEVLRTTFHCEAGRAFQRIHPAGVLQFEEISFEHLAELEAADRIEQCRIVAARQAFEVDRLPLITWTLCRVSDREHVLLHREHHLLHDGWSFFLLLGELFEHYRAAVERCQTRLPPPRAQIADFAVAQRRWVETGLFDNQVTFWRAQLSGSPPMLALPADRPRPSQPSHRGDTLRFQLPSPLVRSVRQFGRREAATFFVATLTPFAALLARVTGEADLCVGTGVANRRARDSGSIVGMIINNLVLRLRPAGRSTWRQLLGHVRETVVAALANQDVPFDCVVRALEVPRIAGVQPLCQVFFSAYDGPIPETHLPGLEVTADVGLSTSFAKFDLNVMLIPQPDLAAAEADHAANNHDRVTMAWEFSTDLWDRENIQRLADRYVELLQASIENPDAPFDAASLTSESERRWLCEQATGRATAYPRDASIAELFERQVTIRPEACAVIDRGERLRYRDLSQRADRVAAALCRSGIGSEDVVGVLLERGAPAIIAMLGILKAGAAYMPLNASDPQIRLASLIKDAGARMVTTRRDLVRHLDSQAEFLLVDELPSLEYGTPQPLRAHPDEDSLACVLFTSGSTGQPKGVEVTHRGIARLLFGQDYVEFGPAETILQLAPLSFDASTFEIWGALLHGSTLVVHAEDLPSLGALERTIQEHGVTTMWLGAALFNLIIDERVGLLQPLRQLLIGGEALSISHVRRALVSLPHVAIINGYGPTENTTFSCCYTIPRDLPGQWPSIPVGRPLANSTVYVLDDRQRPTPIGMTGEIYVGGDGVARGYRHQPDRTAECFVRDPFTAAPSARMYRTGDLGAVLEDGTIQFRGRRDEQVKINGFRIEPGEIEEAIKTLPGVRTCVVRTVRTAPDSKRLAAAVDVGDADVTSVTIREQLRERLPAHMMPSQIMVVEHLPVGVHGKVDREAVADLLTAAMSRPVHASHRQPETATEAAVLSIFQEILACPDLGVDDNFFVAGGHSLLAAQVTARISDQLGVVVDLSQFFRAPTVAAICAALSTGTAPRPDLSERWQYLLPIRERGVGSGVFFVPGGDGGEGAMGVYSRLADFVPERSFYGFRATRLDGGERLLEPTVERLAASFIREMQQVQPHGPYDLSGGCIGGIIAFEMARQLSIKQEKVRRLVLVDTVYPSRHQQMRQLVRGGCSRVRCVLQRRVAVDGRLLGRRRAFYDFISSLLPFSETDAGAEVKRVWIRFSDVLLRYRPRPYLGQIHLVLSEEMAASTSWRAWARCTRGGLVVTVVPGDHWSYVREHVSSAGQAFCLALEHDDQASKTALAAGGDGWKG